MSVVDRLRVLVAEWNGRILRGEGNTPQWLDTATKEALGQCADQLKAILDAEEESDERSL